MNPFAETPEPPFYAVIFTSLLSSSQEGYESMSKKLTELVTAQPGFLGLETSRSEIGITISYWSDLESISRWKENLEHLKAQKLGKVKWYSGFKVRICRVEKEYSFEN
ncbi:MAG: antibiotic biosynthesis monooxygenase [Spirochaetia bacterium]|nr:antibiotic biosynthesis monooxygenase [Spirochaetia bacterium]